MDHSGVPVLFLLVSQRPLSLNGPAFLVFLTPVLSSVPLLVPISQDDSSSDPGSCPGPVAVFTP